MKVKQKRKLNIQKVALMFMLCVFSLLFLASPSQMFAYADNEEIEYTSVLEDLRSDENFDILDYPVIAEDNSMQVISIAESINQELFVFVYQPSANILATSINIATVIQDKMDYLTYRLKLISQQDALYKYSVQDFEVTSDLERVYEISSIYRAWDDKLDTSLETGETVSEVPYSVGKQYIVTDDSINCTDIDMIKVTNKHVGFVRYLGGASYWGAVEYVDSHYVAFSTDKPIDKLLNADVYFQTQYKIKNAFKTAYGEVVDNYSKMTSKDIVTYQTDYNFWKNSAYEWQRIQSTEEFVKSQDFTSSFKQGILNIDLDYSLDEDVIETIKNTQWVLRFYESKYEEGGSGLSQIKQWTTVSNVSLLRLKFETTGKVYNLGVVDNKQTGLETPDNHASVRISINWTVFSIAFGLLLIILLIIFAPGVLFRFLKSIFKGIGYTLKGFWWVITSPIEIFDSDGGN